MKSIFAFLCLTVGFASVSSAYTYVKCGKSLNEAGDDVVGYELELSSESDVYDGAVGGSWNLKLRSEESAWIESNPNITAQTVGENIEIRLAMGRSVTGPVGSKYVLKGLYTDYPVLEKYTMGGFAGNTRVGIFECYSAND